MDSKTNPQPPVAIIGIGCIFAKSIDLKGYLHLLLSGTNGITDPPASHQQLYDCFDPDPKKPDHIYCNRGGFLPQVDFDPTEFGIPPHNLEATDTSQLLGLMIAKQALLDAGYGDGGKQLDRERCSIILGVTGTQELVIPLGARMGHPNWRRALDLAGVPSDQADDVVHNISESMVAWQENSFPGLLGNVVSGRIANRLDLGGTNCVVDAACASSTGALRMAIMELTGGHSDMVITGGVDTINDAFMHMCFSRTRILSASGDIRPFSEVADGTVLGEGIGMVVLKKLEDARRDGDRIYAVIRGIGSSSDGKSQSIYSPRVEGQKMALERAYGQAGIEPADVELVEAHGTGTRVGDQVEFKSLCEVFGPPGDNTLPCALGSVKSSIGHTKAAAGTAGLIKAALALHHKMLPPTLKAEKPDPKLEVEKSRFYLNTRLRPWVKSDGKKRSAGVSAFGFGGSNFHVVLEEPASRKDEPSWDGSIEILAFSGAERQAVEEQLNQWNDFLESESNIRARSRKAADIRKVFDHRAPHRMVIVLDHWDDEAMVRRQSRSAVSYLERWENEKAQCFDDSCFMGRGPAEGPMAFLFPGQGSQYAGMGRDLLSCFPESLDAFQEAEKAFDGPQRLSDLVYPLGNSAGDQSEVRLRATQIAQPALGAVSIAMFEALKRFGITPAATCGHSYGELAALHAAGWMSRTDLWRLTIQRGRLMAAAGQANGDSGAMLAVKAPIDDLRVMADSLGSDIVLANLNSPAQGVFSGTREGIEALRQQCRRRDWPNVLLPVSAAFHSPLIHDAQIPFQKMVDTVAFTPGSIDVMCNVSGDAYPQEEMAIRALLGRQLASPVDFIADVEKLYGSGIRTFVEVGPKSVLTSLVQSILVDRPIQAMSLDRSAGRNSGMVDLAKTIAQLASLGYEVHLERWEKTLPPDRQARMTIPLNGANYRNPKTSPAMRPRKPVRKHNPSVPDRAPVDTVARQNRTAVPSTAGTGVVPTKAQGHRQNASKSPNGIPRMKTMNNPDLSSALTAIQHGLASITELQSQTAQAHQKFLEAQTEAGRTLRDIMYQLASLTMGKAPVADASMREASPLQSCAPEPIQKTVSPAVKAAPPTPETRHPELVVESEPARPLPTETVVKRPGNNDGRIQQVLVEIVGELTGYPAEMLGLDLDIESDLGIDSIKRVEILSSLEERLPELPRVTPDMMGTLKTLGQILQYLTTSAPTPGQTPSSEGTADTTPANTVRKSASNHFHGEEIQQVLVEIVGELTGYPAEMLGLDLDIESDLGIDSIKRVEILSSLEERLPELPRVTPDMMGTLKTLGQILQYLTTSAPTPGQTPSSEGTADTTPANTVRKSASNHFHGEEIQQVLVEIVGELTGYPAEMLGLDLDIESDLGIDSIKRVEILSSLEERLPELPRVTPDMMGTLKTLGQIVDYLAANGTEQSAEVKSQAPQADGDSTFGPDLPRYRICIQPKAFGPEAPSKTFEDPIGLVCQGEDLAAALASELKGLGSNVVLMKRPEDLHQQVRLAGLMLVAPMSPEEAFLWAREGRSRLDHDVVQRAPFFFTVSCQDGAFGFHGNGVKDPLQGALAGLVKTAMIEWPEIRCKAIDIDPEWEDHQQIAQAVAAEVAADDTDVEIGLGPVQGRIVLYAVPEAPDIEHPIQLDTQDVVVVSGGARGVTASAAITLAERTGCRLALLGRSPRPEDEPHWMRGLEDEAVIKKAILEHQFSGQTVSPRDIESAYRRWMANRQVRRTMERLENLNVAFRYDAVDVCDAEAVVRILAEIRSDLGPVKGLIHGAGVLEDRHIADKKLSQFRRVFNTKVKGMAALMAATRSDALRYIVCFSSVAARMGNSGQVDYAMANEVLNKMAQREQVHRPGCKVISINWGPWDGGMVTPALKRNFAKNNVRLIPVKQGALAMLDEMASPIGRDIEIVIGGPLIQPTQPASSGQTSTESAKSQSKDLWLTAKRDIDIDGYPILRSHMLNGRPVVPLALMTEWLAHSALHANPGLVLHGMDHLRLYKGISPNPDGKRIQLMAGKVKPVNGHYEVDVEIRDGMTPNGDMIHTSARAILSDRLPSAPKFKENGHFNKQSIPLSLSDAYDRILFHGQDLRGIRKILGISAQGIAARIATAPPPDSWVKDPLRSRWIADPLVLDCAFQMAILWCHHHHNQVSLPIYAATYRQYREAFPSDNVLAVLDVRKSSEHKMVGDFTFLDEAKHVVARLEGYEAIMDPDLIHKFHPN